MNMTFYQDAAEAMEDAFEAAPQVVGYLQGRGWTIYHPKDGSPSERIEPEMLCLASGAILPLSEIGAAVFESVMCQKAGVLLH